MPMVDSDLYDFLKEHETGTYHYNDNYVSCIVCFVRVHFNELKDFVDIVGEDFFTEPPLPECKLLNDHVCIDLNDIITSKNGSISDYKECFENWDDDWSVNK